jgi:hypothetical protein
VLISRLNRHPPLDPTSIVPRSQDHGERPFRPIRQKQRQSQMAEESVQSWNGRVLLPPLLGQLKRAGQVRLAHWSIRLVSYLIQFL